MKTSAERAAELVQNVAVGTNLDNVTVAGVVFHECHRLVAEDLVRDLRATIAAALEAHAREAVEAERAEVERLKDVLHRDRTGLAAALNEVRAIAHKYAWAAEGRGPYEFDDDEYRREFGRCLLAITRAAREALEASGRLAHVACCGPRAPPEGKGGP